MRRRPLIVVLSLGCVALLETSCDEKLLGLPQIALASTSPDGRDVAFVRNHVTIDPPDQSVWLGPADGEANQIKNLGGDSDWCNTIVWSSDNSTVAFLIQDARLLTVDRRSRAIVSEKWLTEYVGEYPPYRFVTDLTLSADGREARFRDCARRVRGGLPPGSCRDARVSIR